MPEVRIECSKRIEEAILDKIKSEPMTVVVICGEQENENDKNNDSPPSYEDLKDKKFLSLAERKYLIGKRYLEEKQEQGGNRKAENYEIKGRTASKIADESQVSESFVKRAAVFAKAVDEATDEDRRDILLGRKTL